jgi:methylthioribose-1-phosphate isomerase
MTDHIYWKDGVLYLLDQRRLPFKKVYVPCTTEGDVVRAIRKMVVRGAPLIGITAAYGVVLGVGNLVASRKDVTGDAVDRICRRLGSARPTAQNLFWALERMKDAFRRTQAGPDMLEDILDEAISIHVEDIENNRMLSTYGAELIDDGDIILTHCNAGALATGGYGTALGVIRAAHEGGKKIRVIATETRPYLQGARLTAWELHQEGIPVEVVPDNHVGFLASKDEIDKVVVGADRIALNGDVANKIGTFIAALVAHRFGIPFYVAAPLSTFDPKIPSGAHIEIEERDGDEVKYLGKTATTLPEIKARYYAFDVTPARLVTHLITEKGIIGKPFRKYIKMLFS